MCGIAGVASISPVPISRETLVAMAKSMVHRGPDDEGFYEAPGVGLAHRRLSIIDLSEAGRQPIGNEDGSVQVILNGEIYNYRELRRELAGRGHRLRTETDSEVLVHLYEDFGLDLVHRLRGMFSFALWDDHRRQLVLVRDRMGIKPLYYGRDEDGGIVFGSEIKALVASGRLSCTLSPAAISEYLGNRYTTGRTTFYREVRKLLPGELAVWRDGHLDVRRYWSALEEKADLGKATRSDLTGRFLELFEESVRLRMISDAPIGVFLSGGIDSSAIAAVMARHTSGRLRTFSVGFAEREADELSYARLVASRLGAEHHEVVVSGEEFFQALPDLIWHEDEPIAFASSVPLYFVSRLAAESVKVVLTGEGSDELLGGYAKYWKTDYLVRLGGLYERLPGRVRRAIAQTVLRAPAGKLRSMAFRTPLVRDASVPSLYVENFGLFDGRRQSRLLTGDFTSSVVEESGAFDPFRGHADLLHDLEGLPVFERLLALDLATYLQELLMKQDQMSMAASLESRVPFLDHELVAFARGLPRSMKLSGFRTKRILRDAVQGMIPDSVLKRRKWGFPTPLKGWLAGEFTHVLDETILSERAASRGVTNADEVSRLVGEHRSGRVDHTERLWALVNLEMWFRTCYDGRPTRALVG